MNVPPCLWKGRFMRRVLFTGLLCIAGVLAAASPQAQQSSAEPAQSQTPFHSVTHAVSIYATIVDSTGRLVTDISRDEFEIYDNGKKQNLTLFDNGIQPITIVIMLDRSGSMVKNFDLERDAAERFVADLLPTDKARLGSFSNRIEIDPPSFTSNKDDLIRILHENLLDAGVTPLWNATDVAMLALERQEGRRVVLVFTDGYDNPEQRPDRQTVTFGQVLSRAAADEIMVYAIGLAQTCESPTPAANAALEALARSQSSSDAFDAPVRYQRGVAPPRTPPLPGVRRGPDNGGAPVPPNPGMPIPGVGTPLGPGVNVPVDKLLGRGHTDSGCSTTKPDPSLKDLAAEGGGGYFELHATDDLAPTFARVADELHRQYLLAFTPATLDGRTHNLEIRVRRPGLTIRARHSYIAAAR